MKNTDTVTPDKSPSLTPTSPKAPSPKQSPEVSQAIESEELESEPRLAPTVLRPQQSLGLKKTSPVRISTIKLTADPLDLEWESGPAAWKAVHAAFKAAGLRIEAVREEKERIVAEQEENARLELERLEAERLEAQRGSRAQGSS